ncbi:MAG: hypothetical protein ABI564_03995 [Ideonella sp.]
MTTATFQRRLHKTGRPLGWLDVFGKIAEDASSSLRSGIASLFGTRPLDREAELALEAASVRRFADSQRDSSPAFAADLYAAADRHERIG